MRKIVLYGIIVYVCLCALSGVFMYAPLNWWSVAVVWLLIAGVIGFGVALTIQLSNRIWR